MKKNIFKFFCLLMLTAVTISCDSDEDIDPNSVENELFLVVESSKILRNQEIGLQLVDAADRTNTSAATFFVDGQPFDGSTFSSASEGVYEVYAQYNLAGTNVETERTMIEVFIPKRKVLVEDFTGTWCGYCPRMTTLIEDAQVLTSDISVVSIHGNSIFTGTDPFTIDEGMFLKDFFEVAGYPTGIIDRGLFWDQNNSEPQIMDAAGLDSDLSISMSSNLQGDELTVDVGLISESGMENLNLVVFLLEDNLIADQSSYFNLDPNSPYYQMGVVLVGFRHDHVLRMSLTEPLGDAIANTNGLDIFSRTITATIPSQFDSSQLSLVAFVTNATTHEAINSQHVRVGEVKGFE